MRRHTHKRVSVLVRRPFGYPIYVPPQSALNMKAITAVCATGAAVPANIAGGAGRISRHRDGENAEIQMYLSKLKDLVPYMPKNKKLSKLEVIQNVIDYICDLQSALETTGAGNSAAVAAAFDASAVLGGALSGSRQPLGVRPTPNTIHRPASQQSNGSSASHSPSASSCDLNTHTVSVI